MAALHAEPFPSDNPEQEQVSRSSHTLPHLHNVHHLQLAAGHTLHDHGHGDDEPQGAAGGVEVSDPQLWYDTDWRPLQGNTG